MGVDVEGSEDVRAEQTYQGLEGQACADKQYSIDEALALVKELATAKFNETVDVAVNLGIDAKKSDQQVRGSTVLPHGTGKSGACRGVHPGARTRKARAAGADVVGFEDLAEKVKAGDRLRRRHREPGCHARRRPAGPDPRSPRPDAEPEGRHGDPGCRDRCA
jgi:ribosomal protein L1